MFDIQNYHSFILAIIIFQLLPGPGTLAILRSTASGGIKSGMIAVFGTLAGDLIYMSSAVMGLAAVLAQFPFILKFAQGAGASYLVFSGLQLLFTKPGTRSNGQETDRHNYKIFRQALTICLTNPKAIMFFMAFFPLFLTHTSKPATLWIMMIHVTFISLVYQTILVLTGNTLAQILCKWKYSRTVATRLSGIAFIAFGVKLVKDIK